MTLYYLDTSIWLDFHEKRGENGEHALKLIINIIALNEVILFSDLHIREFKNVGYSLDELSGILQLVKPLNLRRIHVNRNQIAEARRLAVHRNVPAKDALHAVLARDNDAVMFSRDRHFARLRDVVETKRPEELY